MRLRYITRSLEPVIRRAARDFPAVVLTGPRQSGKTTLLTRMFAETCRYAGDNNLNRSAGRVTCGRYFEWIH